MKKIVSIVLLILVSSSMVMAQAQAPATAPKKQPQPDKPAAGQPVQPGQPPQNQPKKKEGPVIIKPQAGLQSGIRFVFGMTNTNLDKALMPINKETFVEVPMRFGLPAARVPYPEDRVIRFYKEIPTKENKEQPFFKAELPANVTGKNLGIFCFAGNQMQLSYIDEKDCQPGLSIIKNMTGNSYLFIIPNAPTGEKDKMILGANQEWKFAQSLPKANRSLATEIRKEMTLPNGQKQWFVERKMMLKTDKVCGNIVLILPHASGNSIQIQPITIYKD